MSLNQQAFPAPPENSDRIRQLYLRPDVPGAEQNYVPRFYLEAKIDFADVRSGCHLTRGMNQVLEMIPFDGDLLWTRDMVRSVDQETLLTTPPPEARLGRLPEFVTAGLMRRIETSYVSYLLRHAELRIFRNFALNAYSHPEESREDFQTRCLEMLNEAFRADIDSLHEVVNRRLERIEERYLVQDQTGEFEWDRRVTQARSRLHAVTESITELFLETELTLCDDSVERRLPDPARPDMEQRLDMLETDIKLEIRRLLNSYQEKLKNIDEYVIHPNFRDIHLVRTCILWMPAGA